MDIQTLAYTLKSYTVEQDRNLLRYRLILSDAQRDQLTHTLIAFKDRPPLPYYFFHQNCGSVLVRVVGEGIGEASVADFRPWVSPPHSLCALLIREGIAERARPDFHSTRTQGDLYREWFRLHYPQWTAETAELPWPAMNYFLRKAVDPSGYSRKRGGNFRMDETAFLRIQPSHAYRGDGSGCGVESAS